MPPDAEAAEGSWGFRSFLLFVGVLIIAFIAWLVWAMIEFTPTVERDIVKSLLVSPLFQRNELGVTNQPSKCRTQGEVKGNISAGLFQSFLDANATPVGNLELHRFQKEANVLDGAKLPEQWREELGMPVMAISNIGVFEDRAMVCLELHSRASTGMLVSLEHAGADYWRISHTETIWTENLVETPEEIPELTIPSVE